ncbi:2-dehydropantoate 2-reductase N-terminal domain-containing protein [Thalassospiraceae bacterium LMO-JJ14]|nr:2-dehydropantoate 2-reductase N-terminal domain-containing protein [Thalassospiraceae bacterium LMO-JJ14]
MAYKILILGASYGSLLGTKLLMAGHDVTLVCRSATSRLINTEGTEVRIRLKGEDAHRAIRSGDLPGHLDAMTPEQVKPEDYDLVCLAMQEPQYSAHEIWTLMVRIADACVPCLSIMNMPPLSYLKRIDGLDTRALESSYTNSRVWDRFDPELMTLCSPDPQAFRPPEEGANILHVGLPTNFKAARFRDVAQNEMLHRLEADIDAVRLEGKDVPVKLRVYGSLFVPLAKWSMLLTGNYRCITNAAPISIRDAVHTDIERSREIYTAVDALTAKLGADLADAVPFEKYAKAAENLLKPSSAARAIDAGAPFIERVDLLVSAIAKSLGMENTEFTRIAETVDAQLKNNHQ